MSDRWVLAAAAATVVGALVAHRVPLVLALLLTVGAFAVRRPPLLCLGLLLLASELGHRAEAGLRSVEPGDVRAEIELVADPRPSFGGIEAEGRLGASRVLLRAEGSAAHALEERLAGERVRITGSVEPIEPSAWAASRHLAGQVTVWRVEGWWPGPPVTRFANRVRHTLVDGAASMTDDQRHLYTGLVVGDDRHQSAATADDFQASGLTHLSAVSGQNVAFVLAAASPVLRRLRLWPRCAVALLVIGLFALVTRFEPSVLRASAVAALSVVSATIGRPADRIRLLGLAMTALVIVDPLLVHAVGFRLSVAAAAGILVGAPRVVSLLPGPTAVREAVAVTIAAQLAVAPILVTSFGPMPIAAVPANLLAVPAAGVVMVWGMTAGLLAGVLGGGVAGLLHLPTGLLLDWIAGVARAGATLPLGSLDGLGVAVAGAGVTVAVVLRERRMVRRVAGSVVVALVGVAVLGALAPPPLRASPHPGVVVWRAGGSVAVVLAGEGADGAPSAETTLEAVRRAGVRRVDVVVLADEQVDPSAVGALVERYRGAPVLAAAGSQQEGARELPPGGSTVPVGGLELRIVDAGARLVVEGQPAGGRG